LPDEPKIPKLTGTADAAALRLSAVEGFVLSRIDGKANESELAGLTGLNATQVRGAIEKLVSLKVITLAAKEAPVPRLGSGPSSPSGPGGTGPSDGAPALPPGPGGEAPAAPMAAAKRIEAAIEKIPRDAPELTEDIDLSEMLRKRVLGTTTVLESLDYYELLSLDRDADKKAIKRSYFELASVLHPDRYFRKRLGSFKPKMEAIFGRVTQAYEALQSKEQRAEYDAYLTDLDRTRSIEDLLRNADEEAKRAESDAQQAATRSSFPGGTPDGVSVRPAPATGSGPPPDQAARSASAPPAKISGFYTFGGPRASPPPAAPASPSRPPGSPVVTDQARRDVLAMRLLGNRAGARGASMPPASAPRGDGGEMLKRRYEERVAQARKAQGEKYAALAREAEKKNDVLGAATAYRVATGLLKEGDPALSGAAAIIAKAEASLAENYLRQALYEERAEHWTDAARSWQRVARARPDDAKSHERAASALAKSKGDLHVAAELAKRAIQIEPRNAEYKITLATVFLEAGLHLNARRELEAAAQLSPRNATIQALMKRVNKAG
jgi:DnaJ domain